MRLVNNQKSKLALIPLLFLIVTLIIHIAYFIISLFKNRVLWWDQSVYILIGRYFFSLGKEGFFESIRPPVWPFILGLTWKMGFNDILMSRLLSLIFTIGAALLVFLITRELFDEESALLSSGLFLINYLFLFYEQTGLTSIPSIFFALMGLYLLLRIMMKMIKNTMEVLKALFVGILIGIATMTRFPQGMVMIIVTLFFIYNLIKAKNNTISSNKINNRTKNRTLLYTTLYVILGFLIITTPYLIWNYVAYKDPLHTLKLASDIIRRTPPKKTLFYYWIILVERIETYLWLIGIFYFFKKEIRVDKKRFVLFFNILLPLSFIIYHSTIGFKTTRFLLVCLPYIIIPSGFGIKTIREILTDYSNRLFYKRRKRKGSEKRKGKRRSKTTNNSLLNQSRIITTAIIIIILTLLIIENIILLNKITRYYGNNIVQKQQEELVREIREIKIKEITALSNKIVLDNKENIITIGVSSPIIALALQKESNNLIVNYRIEPIYYPSFEDFLSVINKTNESNGNNKKPDILLIQEKDIIPTTMTRMSDKEFRDYFFKTIRSCYEERVKETNNEEASKEEINKANKLLLFWRKC